MPDENQLIFEANSVSCRKPKRLHPKEKERKERRTLSGIFINMRRHILLPNLRLRHALLIRAHRRNHTQRPRVDLAPSITHNTHHHLFPPVLTPRLASVPLTQMRNILDHTVHRPAEQLLVFVVHGHDDEQLRATRRVVVHLTESEARVFEIIGIAGGCGVPHMGEFAFGTVRTHVEQLFGHCVVEDKVAVEESV
jgi:hypothetical protein